MVVANLRPLLLLAAGAAVGSLLTIGLANHPASVEAKADKAEVLPKDLRRPSTDPLGNEPVLNNNTQAPDNSDETADTEAAEAMVAARQRVPMKPIPKPTITFQANGLPVGVTANAGISDVYKRLPGVQPPLINRDGRDIGAEAVQMLENRTEMPFPGGVPSASATPMPFPGSAEEANRQAQSYVSPSPAPQ
jgi:hypothetical protein